MKTMLPPLFITLGIILIGLGFGMWFASNLPKPHAPFVILTEPGGTFGVTDKDGWLDNVFPTLLEAHHYLESQKSWHERTKNFDWKKLAEEKRQARRKNWSPLE